MGKSLGCSEEEEDSQPSPIRNLQGAHGNPHFLGEKKRLKYTRRKEKKAHFGVGLNEPQRCLPTPTVS